MDPRDQVNRSAMVLLVLMAPCLQLHHHLQLRRHLLRVLFHRRDHLDLLVLEGTQDSWDYQDQGMKDKRVELARAVEDIQLPGN